MTATQLRDHLGERIDAAHYRGDITLITKNGQIRAVLVPHDVYRQAVKSAGHR